MALSPTLREYIDFSSIKDVHDELIRINDECQEQGFSMGEGLYTQAGYFCDRVRLLNSDAQDSILQFQYSRLSHTPPYPSIIDTPVKLIDNFLIIDQEIKLIDKRDK